MFDSCICIARIKCEDFNMPMSVLNIVHQDLLLIIFLTYLYHVCITNTIPEIRQSVY